jgi:hypothetical protein
LLSCYDKDIMSVLGVYFYNTLYSTYMTQAATAAVWLTDVSVSVHNAAAYFNAPVAAMWQSDTRQVSAQLYHSVYK